jgi:hypothetical protein
MDKEKTFGFMECNLKIVKLISLNFTLKGKILKECEKKIKIILEEVEILKMYLKNSCQHFSFSCWWVWKNMK